MLKKCRRLYLKVLCLIMIAIFQVMFISQVCFAGIISNNNDLLKDNLSKTKLHMAFYTQQNAYLHTFWDNVDMDQVDSDFREMKRRGFNTVWLGVGIGDIISSVNLSAGTYVVNDVKKQKLNSIIEKATNLGLYTVIWTTQHRIPEGWGGTGVAGQLRKSEKDLLGQLNGSFYGYVIPGLQGAAYGNDSNQSVFRWTLVKEMHNTMAALTVGNDRVIFDPLDPQYIDISTWDWGGPEILVDWRAYLKKTNTNAGYWQQRWGESQTGSWNDIVLPLDQLCKDYANDAQVSPGDPILIYKNMTLTPESSSKWADFSNYTNAGMIKMNNELTAAIKSVNPNSTIVQRLDYWRHGFYRDSTWGTGQVDLYAYTYYPSTDSDVPNLYNNFLTQISDVRNRLSSLGRIKPIMAYEIGFMADWIYSTSISRATKEEKQRFSYSEYLRLIQDANLCGSGWWTYEDSPGNYGMLVGINSMTGRIRPSQTDTLKKMQLANENGGFEKSANGQRPDLWQTAWTAGNSTGAYAIWTSLPPHIEGNYEYRLYNGTGDPNARQFVLSDKIPVFPGLSYNLNAQMRYGLSGTGTAEFTVLQYDNNNALVTQNTKFFSNGGWTWNSNVLPFTTGSSTSYIQIRFSVGGTSGEYLDLENVKFIDPELHINFDNTTNPLIGEDGENPITSAGVSSNNGFIGAGANIGSTSSNLKYKAQGNMDVNAGTVETWIRPNWNYDSSGAGSNKTIFYREGDQNNYMRLSVDYQKTLKIQWMSSGNLKTETSELTGWKSGVWHHVTVTWDNSGSKSELYIDGVKVKTITGWTPGQFPESSSIYIGNRAGTECFDGNIDNFHIYSYVRSSVMINKDYRGAPTAWFNFVNGLDGYDTETGIYNNISLVADRENRATHAISHNDTSKLTYNAVGNFNPSAGTVETWVKTDLPYSSTPTNKHQYIFNWCPSSWNNEIKLYLWGQNSISADIYVNGTRYNVGSSIAGWETGSYHHVAMTWNKEKQTLKLYVDGVLKGSATLNTFLTAWVDEISIGSFMGQSDKWKGTIDDVMIYSYDRSDSEILKSYRGY